MRVVLVALVLGACGGGSSNGAAVCGDKIVDLEIEECDDGNLFDGDGCSAQCRDEGCGDGIVDADEECDDGNDVDDDSCSNTCVRNTSDVASLAVSWTFMDLANGMATECPQGFDTVAVESKSETVQQTDLFDCAPGAGTVTLPPDVYKLHLDVVTTALDVTYATALPAG